MDNVKKKDWGVSTRLLSTPFFLLYRQEVNNFIPSSTHYHAYLSNYFYVEEGEITVYGYNYSDELQIAQNNISKGGSLIIPPNVKHYFVAASVPAILFEAYFHNSILDSEDDIIRLCKGGTIIPKQ